MFEDINFEGLNETDIREEVLAPVIRKLGYRSGTENNVIREQQLIYPNKSLGRKKKSDPEIRGVADYLLTTKDSINWVIEAKSPSCNIDKNVVEQAYSYANHPEIRATYFVLCNGKKFQVYMTNRGPNYEAILDLEYIDFNDSFEKISNLLSPKSLLRDFPDMKINLGEPLGDNLRSIARINSGIISYLGNNLNIPALSEMQTSILNGVLERNEEGNLVCVFETVAPSRSLQELNKKIGLDKFRAYSKDSVLSNSKERLTSFYVNERVTLAQGEKILNISSWQEIVLPMNIHCQVETIASGYLNNGIFQGEFKTKMDYEQLQKIELYGRFEIYLS